MITKQDGDRLRGTNGVRPVAGEGVTDKRVAARRGIGNRAPKRAVILWASYFDELAAISFVHEFRKMGISTTIVAVHNGDEKRCSDILAHSHQSLEETLETAESIDCLIIPASSAVLGHFQQDPLLWELVDAVHSRAGIFVMGQLERKLDPEIAGLLPPPFRIIEYPGEEHLLIFARSLAAGIVTGESSGMIEVDASRKPPLIRVANHSLPTSVAGAMAGIVREYGFAEAQSVGVSAGHQMLKAATIARKYLEVDRLALFMVPDFTTVYINGQSRSAIRLFLSAWPVDMESQVDWSQNSAMDDMAMAEIESAEMESAEMEPIEVDEDRA